MSVAFVVVTGGNPLDPRTLDGLPPERTVVAADSGADHARAAGLAIDILVGDLDSVSPQEVERLESESVPVDSHPAEKDQTDLELAFRIAIDRGATSILLLGGDGGRLDHFLANAQLLCSPAWSKAAVAARMGPARLWVVRRPTELTGAPGELLTLLAMHGPARGIVTEGLGYALAGGDLWPGSSRGVSNVFLGERAHVKLAEGVLLAVAPGANSA